MIIQDSVCESGFDKCGKHETLGHRPYHVIYIYIYIYMCVCVCVCVCVFVCVCVLLSACRFLTLRLYKTKYISYISITVSLFVCRLSVSTTIFSIKPNFKFYKKLIFIPVDELDVFFFGGCWIFARIIKV